MAGTTRHIVVIGGGIAGLSAAWELVEQGSVRVTVIEADERLGGKILTTPMESLGMAPIDEGADAFLARDPAAVDLCEELGLGDQLVEPSATRAQVWASGERRFLPSGTVLGVPVEFDSLESCGLLSDEGLAVARNEPLGTWEAPTDDVSIGEFLTRRYGHELTERVVAPLVGGINAGDIGRLSLRAVTPQLWAAARVGGSLTRALRAARDSAPPQRTGGMFRGLRGGTGTLVDALCGQLAARGVTFLGGLRVRAVRPDGTAWTIAAPNMHIPADGIVLATPANAAADVLTAGRIDRAATEALASIEFASVSMVRLVYPRSAFHQLDPDVSGVLVPRTEGMLTTAVSIGSNKWPHWTSGRHTAMPAEDATARSDMVVLRASIGHSGDDLTARLHEGSLRLRMLPEIEQIMGVAGIPAQMSVSRWIDGFAQYGVGHIGLIDGIDEALASSAPTIRLTGASYRGLGIPACIYNGRRVARELVSSL